MRIISIIAAGVFAQSLMSGATAQDLHTAKDREHQVMAFVAAFNQQDADAMVQMLTPQAQWLSVDGEKITAEGSSRDAIGKSMRAYFKSCPTCRSRLAGVVATANRLTAVEVAQWQTGAGKQKEQRGVSVYEFAGPLISRVYYFPAETVR